MSANSGPVGPHWYHALAGVSGGQFSLAQFSVRPVTGTREIPKRLVKKAHHGHTGTGGHRWLARSHALERLRGAIGQGPHADEGLDDIVG